MGFLLRIHELEEQEVITYLINNGRSQWVPSLWPGFAAVLLLGLRPIFCWDCEFNFLMGHGRLSLVSFHVEVSATGRFVVQRSPTECACVTECDQTHQ